MTRGEKIKAVRERIGLSQTSLADKINVSKQTMYKYESDIITNIPIDKIEAIAQICNCSPQYLMGWDEDDTAAASSAPAASADAAAGSISREEMERYGLKPVKTRKFRLIGKIACGEPIFANEDFETFIEASADIKADYCLEAKGDSMTGARIFPGDIIFIKECRTVDNGDIAVVIIDDEATLKRVYYYPEQQTLRLVSENPAYSPFIYAGEELEHVHILGKAVFFQSMVR